MHQFQVPFISSGCVLNFNIDIICFSYRWISSVQLRTWIKTRCNKIKRTGGRWCEACCCNQACRENWLNRTGQISIWDWWKSGSLNTTKYWRQYLCWWVTSAPLKNTTYWCFSFSTYLHLGMLWYIVHQTQTPFVIAVLINDPFWGTVCLKYLNSNKGTFIHTPPFIFASQYLAQ